MIMWEHETTKPLFIACICPKRVWQTCFESVKVVETGKDRAAFFKKYAKNCSLIQQFSKFSHKVPPHVLGAYHNHQGQTEAKIQLLLHRPQMQLYLDVIMPKVGISYTWTSESPGKNALLKHLGNCMKSKLPNEWVL